MAVALGSSVPGGGGAGQGDAPSGAAGDFSDLSNQQLIHRGFECHALVTRQFLLLI